MAANSEMLNIACSLKPNAVCIVPENRSEVTTEGGLLIVGQEKKLTPFIQQLKDNNIRVSLFIDPREREIKAAGNVGADIVEFHTGGYCDATLQNKDKKLDDLISAAMLSDKLGIEVHAGHGLNFDNVAPVAAIAEIKELNIGHFIVGEAVFSGLENVIKKMHQIIREASK